MDGVAIIVFSDLVDSTALLTRLGDDRMDEIRRAHIADVRSAVLANRGRLIKTLGDSAGATLRRATPSTCAATRAGARFSARPRQRLQWPDRLRARTVRGPRSGRPLALGAGGGRRQRARTAARVRTARRGGDDPFRPGRLGALDRRRANRRERDGRRALQRRGRRRPRGVPGGDVRRGVRQRGGRAAPSGDRPVISSSSAPRRASR